MVERQEYGNFMCILRGFETEGHAPDFRMMYDWEIELYSPDRYRGGGWFSEAHPPVEFLRHEASIVFSPFNGQMYHLLSNANPSVSVFQDYDRAWDALEALERIPIKNLAGFETVNTHQWTGSPPIEHRAPRSQVVVWRERSAWDVATSDLSAGTRRIMLRGHVSRDYAFVIQQRLQAVADFTRKLMQGWEDIALAHDQSGAQDPEDLKKEHREEGDEFARVLNQRISENMPDWPWLSRKNPRMVSGNP